jgi:hypothetical protein
MITLQSSPLIRITHLLLLVFIFLLASCTSPLLTQYPSNEQQPMILSPSSIPATEKVTPTQTPNNPQLSTSSTQDSPVHRPTNVSEDNTQTVEIMTPTPLSPDDWMTLPIIPSISENAKSIYQRGLAMGSDPHAFSKIGDCQSITTYFLSYFDMPGFYDLGSYSPLQQTIDWYAGSFSRESLSVKGGFNAAAILSPLRADPKQCKPNENPIECEFRLHHPSVVIISLEEWWAGHPENYEAYMRQILDYTIEQGAIPIIATKADNLEGNNLINETIAKLANEYDIPLWNFWSAVQTLPNHGLIEYTSSGEIDMFHLTHSEDYYFYNDPANTQSGWSVRNLTALQALDAVRRALIENP